MLNKIDIKRLDELSEEKKAVFEQFRKDDVRIIEMSTFSEEGVIEVRNEVKKSPFRFFSSRALVVLGLRSSLSSPSRYQTQKP